VTLIFSALAGLLLLCGYLYWRCVWFFRNPGRHVPPGDNIVSPADGTVVYVKEVGPGEEVISIKKGMQLTVSDITREDIPVKKVLIGIFMSPFNVHYNRAPLAGRVDSIRYYPAAPANVNMGAMHFRTLLGLRPYFKNSTHIYRNERKVTRLTGSFRRHEISCYVVQIAGKTVRGIESFVREGMGVGKGDIFGMIRIGSQVDVVVPWLPEMRIAIKPGDRVRAGGSVLIE
jgi:phosphatidylserine decarboxylase